MDYDEVGGLWCRDDDNKLNLYVNNFTIWNGYRWKWGTEYGEWYGENPEGYIEGIGFPNNELGTKECPYQSSYDIWMMFKEIILPNFEIRV